VIPFQSDSDRDPEAKTAAELYVDLVVSLVSYLAFDPVDPVVDPATPERTPTQHQKGLLFLCSTVPGSTLPLQCSSVCAARVLLLYAYLAMACKFNTWPLKHPKSSSYTMGNGS
jgi:hypothetical protein